MFLTAPSDQGGGSSFLPLLLLVGLFALMYFMVIRPQSQRRKQLQQLQSEVAPGSEVVTIGGLYGTVVDTDDDDTLILEVAPGVTNRYARGAVGKVLPATTFDEVDDDEDADDTVADDTDPVQNADAVDTTGDASDKR
ncbi:MAG TPA: preprotein translocase subunit YajC [Cryptosporangiaceae bacterium]|nr:preprotein translocase subunit YajC [Cryptosporangiaceae bacterium]